MEVQSQGKDGKTMNEYIQPNTRINKMACQVLMKDYSKPEEAFFVQGAWQVLLNPSPYL